MTVDLDKPVPRIWIGCLASYNAGRLIGEWFDVPTDLGTLSENIKTVIDRGQEVGAREDGAWFNAEEWHFADNEWLPGELHSEWPSQERLVEYARVMEDLDGDRAWAFYAFVQNGDMVDWDNLDRWEDHYRGRWDSFEDFAREHVSDVGIAGIPAGDRLLVCHVDHHLYYGGNVSGSNLIEKLMPYLDMDVIARELEQHFTTIDHPRGPGTFVFESDV